MLVSATCFESFAVSPACFCVIVLVWSMDVLCRLDGYGSEGVPRWRCVHTESVRSCDDCACMHDDNEVRVSERRLYDVTLPLSDMVLCFQRM